MDCGKGFAPKGRNVAQGAWTWKQAQRSFSLHFCRRYRQHLYCRFLALRFVFLAPKEKPKPEKEAEAKEKPKPEVAGKNAEPEKQEYVKGRYWNYETNRWSFCSDDEDDDEPPKKNAEKGTKPKEKAPEAAAAAAKPADKKEAQTPEKNKVEPTPTRIEG